MTKKLHKWFFNLFILLLPLNLGLHFISVDSYVRARLIDYLIPTIWVQQLILILILVFWFFSFSTVVALKSALFDKRFRVFYLFLFSLLPSIAIASNISAALYKLSCLVLYTFLAIYVAHNFKFSKDFSKLLTVLSYVVIFLSFIGIMQWFKQESLFNNYLFFGEQPYSTATLNIAKTTFFGELKIPAYSIFNHPNVFAGFLTIVLLWLFSEILEGSKYILYKVAFVFGSAGLLVTFSQVALLAYLLTLTLYAAFAKEWLKSSKLVLLLIMLFFLMGLLLPFYASYFSFENYPSFYRRANLLKSSYFMLEDAPLFGKGLNNYVVELPNYFPLSQVLVFLQPVHNIFVLVSTESGVISSMFFFSLIFYSLGRTLTYSRFNKYHLLLSLTFLQFFILGSFDHYLYTIHQTQLLFWLTLGLSLTYTNIDA
jgi:hypothetical protein